jgi:glutaredoxin
MKKLIKFSRIGCVPCKALEGYLDSKNVSYQEFDVEEDIKETVKYGVSGVPTLILLDDNGEVLDRIVGYTPPAVDNMINKM